MNAEIDTQGETSLDFLQVYRSSRQPLAVRMRAAAIALPFESPKLTAMAVNAPSGQNFAAMLERAIARSQAPQADRAEGQRPGAVDRATAGPAVKDEPRSGVTILGRCGGGLRLVSDRVRSFEWESYPRREPKPARERLRGLAPLAVQTNRGEGN